MGWATSMYGSKPFGGEFPEAEEGETPYSLRIGFKNGTKSKELYLDRQGKPTGGGGDRIIVQADLTALAFLPAPAEVSVGSETNFGVRPSSASCKST
jgi:hypothetical protein